MTQRSPVASRTAKVYRLWLRRKEFFPELAECPGELSLQGGLGDASDQESRARASSGEFALSSDDTWKSQLVQTLGNLRDPKAVEPLAELVDLRDFSHELKMWDGPPSIWAVPSLQGQYDDWRQFQEELFEAVGQIGGEAAIRVLEKVIVHPNR